MFKNIKTINGFVYILYQIDEYKTNKSRVCFGVYNSYELAYHEAMKNNLKANNSDFIIISAKINQFAEI